MADHGGTPTSAATCVSACVHQICCIPQCFENYAHRIGGRSRRRNIADAFGEKGFTMTIGVVLDFSGATLDQYDLMLQKLDFKPLGPGSPGGLFHWVTATDTGIRVTDVWESQEAFERFTAEKVGPAAAEIGLPNPPEVTIYPVHNYLTAG
ncbi:hypothetical protein [Nocardia sp. NPDC049149]|uniref:hypothetical protein n=1 Tax=Nocardia sp. NPDC049149 TaxID=3364315 RepID=UPI0037123807